MADKTSAPGPSGSAKRSCPPRDQNPPSKRAKSNIDDIALLRYKSHFVAELPSLCVVLGLGQDGLSILTTSAPHNAKYIAITSMWMQCSTNPTWEKFHSCLSKCTDFTYVRTLIEQEHLERHEKDNTELTQLPEDIIALGLGPTGVGKSTFGNFVTGQDNSFEEGHTLEPETKEISLASHWMGDIKRYFRYMDSPGLNHDAADNPDSLAEAIAVSSAQLAMDLREVNLSFSVILIATPLSVRDPSGILLMMNAMQNYDNFWDHSILLLTHANEYCPGLTQEDKEKKFSDMLKSEKCPTAFKSLADKVKGRFVIVESKHRRSDADYRNTILKKIAAHSDVITKTHDHYEDKLHSIGREAYDLSEMQYIKNHPEANPEIQKAKDEIYMKAFLRVKSVALKAIRIKLADGVDVEKLESIARMKDDELQRLEKEKKLMAEELNKKLLQAEEETQQLQGSISKFKQQLDDQEKQMAKDQKNADEKHSQLSSELKAERQRNQQAQAKAQAAQEQLQQQIQGLEHALHKKKKRPWYKF